MALLSTRKLPLIKLIARHQATSRCNNRTATTSALLNRTRHSLLFANTDQKALLCQSVLRQASTTSKKGNVITFTSELTEHAFVDLPAEQQLDLTFSDSKTAFRSKTNFELLRGYLVFQLCGVKFLLDNQKMVKL